MTHTTCTRYYLNPDGSLREETELGRCTEYWRLRDLSLFADPDMGGYEEVQIRLRLHEKRCPACLAWFAECERSSRNQLEPERISYDR